MNVKNRQRFIFCGIFWSLSALILDCYWVGAVPKEYSQELPD